MRKPIRFPRNSAPAAMLLVALVAACSSSTAPSPDYRWAGTYDAETRFGGCTGLWGSGTEGTHLLVISTDRVVTQNGTRILKPTVGDSTISWSVNDGNGSNGNISFHAFSTDACIWGTGGQSGPLFDGTIQFSGEGPLDYRGVKQ